MRRGCAQTASGGASRRLALVFNLSGTELVFIAVLGLIVLGPEKLPGAMRKAGKIYREIRSISSNVQREVQKVMDEPMRQVKSLVEEPANELKKASKDVNDVFAGKMPHLERKPAADAAAAFVAASSASSATASTETPSPDKESPVETSSDAAQPTEAPTAVPADVSPDATTGD